MFFFPIKAKPSRFMFHVVRHQSNSESEFPRGDDVKRTLNFACGKIYTLASNYVDKYSPIFFKKIKGETSITPAESQVWELFSNNWGIQHLHPSTRQRLLGESLVHTEFASYLPYFGNILLRETTQRLQRPQTWTLMGKNNPKRWDAEVARVRRHSSARKRTSLRSFRWAPPIADV